jgi:hypothetical protein
MSKIGGFSPAWTGGYQNRDAVLPPGGSAGFAQMTPASRLAFTLPSSRTSGTRKRRKSATKRASSRKTTSRKTKGRKMKFGSPAWQKKYKVGKFAKKR